MTCHRLSLKDETSTKIWMSSLGPNYNTTRPNYDLNLPNCCSNFICHYTQYSFRLHMVYITRCCGCVNRDHCRSTWRLQSACKLLANLTSTLLKISLGNENDPPRPPPPPKKKKTRKKNKQTKKQNKNKNKKTQKKPIKTNKQKQQKRPPEIKSLH